MFCGNVLCLIEYLFTLQTLYRTLLLFTFEIITAVGQCGLSYHFFSPDIHNSINICFENENINWSRIMLKFLSPGRRLLIGKTLFSTVYLDKNRSNWKELFLLNFAALKVTHALIHNQKYNHFTYSHYQNQYLSVMNFVFLLRIYTKRSTFWTNSNVIFLSSHTFAMNRLFHHKLSAGIFWKDLRRKYSFGKGFSEKSIQLPDKVDVVIIGKVDFEDKGLLNQ